MPVHLPTTSAMSSSLVVAVAVLLGEPLLEVGDAPVLQFRRFGVVAAADRRLELEARLFDLLLDVAAAADLVLLLLPLRLEPRFLFLEVGQLFFKLRQAVL